MQIPKFFRNIWAIDGRLGCQCRLLTCLMLAGFKISSQAQTSLNVTDYGAVGDAVRFSVNTVSNSSIVQAVGQTFSSADIGKVIEVFRTGPWTYYNTHPANGQIVFTNGSGGIFSTQQDTICLLTNVVNGTNLYLSIRQGWTTNTTAIVGRNNAT